MHELRPDVISDNHGHGPEQDADERVLAPTETLDDRDSEQSGFRVNEELSGAGTGYQPKDPAEGGL